MIATTTLKPITDNTSAINQLRQLLCEKPTPELKSKVCALCLNDMMWDMAENVIPGLKEWADRRHGIAVNLEIHSRRHDDGEDYYECRFEMKNLEGADLSGANLIGAYLRETNLSGADLRGASLEGADLYRASLYRADLSGASLRGASLEGADLYRASLYRADLSGASLEGADLRRASLEGADLRRANLEGADLRRANLYGARYNASTQFPEDFSPSDHGMVEVKE